MDAVQDTLALDDYEVATGKDFGREPLVLGSTPKTRGREVL